MARELDLLIDRTLAELADALDALDAPELDHDVGDGKLTIEHAGGTRFIVSRQGAANQIWLAEPGGGWHFDHVGGRWVCDKRGVELRAALEALLSARLGRGVTLSGA